MSGPRIGSLFSGYGGLCELALAPAIGGRVVWFAQHEPPSKQNPRPAQEASRVLAHHWPHTPNHGDVTTIDWAAVEPVDWLVGGFPCTDVSLAGLRGGLRSDTRSGLWAMFVTAIAALRPRFVLIENVEGLRSARAHSHVEPCPGCLGDGPDQPVLLALGAVLGDLATLGFDAEWVSVRAADVGAPHKRERVFVLARDRDPPRGGVADEPHRSDPGGLPVGPVDRAGGGDRGRETPAGIRLVGGAAAVLAGRSQPRDPDRVAGERRAAAGLPREAGPAPGPAPDSDRDTVRIESVAIACSDGPPVAADDGDPGTPPDPRDHRRPRDPQRHRQPGAGVTAPRRDDADRRPVAVADPDRLGRERPRTSRGQTGGGRPPDHPRPAADPDLPRRQGPQPAGRRDLSAWGPYAPAIARWEALTRPAPAPTEPGRDGKPRLHAPFVEWLMGLPAGHVTAVPGVGRNHAIRLCGNGVVPAQAAYAIRLLTSDLASQPRKDLPA